MVSMMVIKKWVTLFLLGSVPILVFMSMMLFYENLIIAGASAGGSLLVMLIITVLMLRHPFTSLIEGSGLLVLNIDSSGLIIPFLCGLKKPYISGKLNGQVVEDVYDRSAVFPLSAPVSKSGSFMHHKEGNKLIIEMDFDLYNKSKFALGQWPTLIWNDQIKSFVTKDMLSEQEKLAFAEHSILYLNKKLEELNTYMKNFARYVIDQLNIAGGGFFKNNPWLFWVIIIGCGLLLLLFAKPILTTIQGFGSSFGGG